MEAFINIPLPSAQIAEEVYFVDAHGDVLLPPKLDFQDEQVDFQHDEDEQDEEVQFIREGRRNFFFLQRPDVLFIREERREVVDLTVEDPDIIDLTQ